jgi:hypothetical protein
MFIPTAPRDVRVVATGDTWCMLCWKSPLSGHSLGYMILMHNNISSTFRNVSVSDLGRKNNMLCTADSDLQHWTDYRVQVAGWNGDEVGISSAPVPVTTRVNRKSHIQIICPLCEDHFLSISLYPETVISELP